MSLIRNPKDRRLVTPLLVAEEGAPCPNGADVVKEIQNFMDDHGLNHLADPEFNKLTDALAPKEELQPLQRLKQLKETRAAEARKETGEEEKLDTTVKVKEEFGALSQFPVSSGKRFQDPFESLEAGKEVAETSEQHHLRIFVFDHLCRTAGGEPQASHPTNKRRCVCSTAAGVEVGNRRLTKDRTGGTLYDGFDQDELKDALL